MTPMSGPAVDAAVPSLPEIPLGADFAPGTWGEWQALAERVVNRGRPQGSELRGDQALATLRSTLPGDLRVDPLYRRPESQTPLGAPGAMPFTRGRALRVEPTWDIRAFHDDPDATATRAAVLADLENGVHSLWVKVGADGIAAADLATVLADVRFEMAGVALTSWDNQAVAAEALLAVLRAHGRPSDANLGWDPIGAAARTGGEPDLGPLADAVRAARTLPNIRAVTVDTRLYHDTGCDVVDELGIALATGLAYVRHLRDQGSTLVEAFGQIDFRLVATSDQFLTTAAFRALRRTWARIGEACGVPEEARGARTHAVTSLRMLTRDDPWVNILRGTIACFAAAVGGADAVTVLPFDTVAGLPDAFSRRLARNTQSLLADESNIARVADPAGGSWYVESLTDDLARRAWAAFQDLERAGGIVAALTNGTIAHLIEEARVEVDEAVARRTAPITGVSMFPNPAESPVVRARRHTLPAHEGALLPRRDSHVFERLRDRSAIHVATTGAPPRVALALLGARRDFGARETFVTNLLAAAGITTVPAGTEEARGIPIVVLASSPKGYAAHAPEAIASARAAGAVTVLVAGRARELPEGSGAVDGEIFAGMDVVHVLRSILDGLGVDAQPATKGADS